MLKAFLRDVNRITTVETEVIVNGKKKEGKKERIEAKLDKMSVNQMKRQIKLFLYIAMALIAL